MAAGAHPEVHQIGALARNGGERTEHAPGPRFEGGGFIDHLQAAAIGEAHEAGHREAGRLAGRGGEEEAVAAVGLVDDEIGVPVGAPQQAIGADALGHHRLTTATEGHQKAAILPGRRRGDRTGQQGDSREGYYGKMPGRG